MDYEKEIKELKIQLANLQNAFIQSRKNDVTVVEHVDESHAKIPQIDGNTSGVEENSMGLLDVADLSDENSSAIEEVAELADENSNAIEDLAEIIDSLDARVTALEEKE